LQATKAHVDEHWIPCQGFEDEQGFAVEENTHGYPNIALGLNHFQVAPPVASNKSCNACSSTLGNDCGDNNVVAMEHLSSRRNDSKE
jgi:hypothetical protein